MELNFSEIDSKNPYESFDNSEKYWEQNAQNTQNTQNTPKFKKKKVSFDDILTNMNLVVNKSGVLQFMSQNQEPQQPQYPQQTQYQQQQQQYEDKKEPLDPSVKHSFIYNKYFKDYQDAIPSTPEVKVPKTKEEYLKMLIEERIRQNEERKRISQIKSTKLLFTSDVVGATIPVSKNGLRKMSFY